MPLITWTTRSMMFTFGAVGSWMISRTIGSSLSVLDFHPIENKEHASWFPCLRFSSCPVHRGYIVSIIQYRYPIFWPKPLDGCATYDTPPVVCGLVLGQGKKEIGRGEKGKREYGQKTIVRRTLCSPLPNLHSSSSCTAKRQGRHRMSLGKK
jgi:hypothetical protein